MCKRVFVGLYGVLWFLFGAIYVFPAQAEATHITKIRLGQHSGGKTRIVAELTDKVAYSYFALSDPYRLVIDLPVIVCDKDIGDLTALGDVLRIRCGRFTADKSRLVIDAKNAFIVEKAFILSPQGGENYRLVFDIKSTDRQTFAREMKKLRANMPAPPKPQTPKPVAIAKTPNKLPVIILDPGHGGVDPGAQGRRRTKEKEVVLAFAKELRKQLNATKRFKVYLTRDTDIYIPLRERVKFARDRNADLFISLHADALKRRNVRGMSFYTLSENASDQEAGELAQKENRSDIIAGVDLDEQSEQVTKILIDLVQRDTKNLSAQFTRNLIDHARLSTRLLERPHRFAGFRVLKAPDVPSVLIELGFLTNISDEKQLRSSKWRRKIAASLRDAIIDYFKAQT